GWSQGWRKPLREGLDGLRDGLSKLYADKSRELFCDPEGARNRYINVLLDRSPERVRTFLIREAGRALSRKEETLAASLLEMEKNLMYMYTSCGWFFDEISGIETLQILAYAARALELGGAIYPEAGLRAPFMECLAGAASNISEFRDGRRIFEIFIEPLKADLHRAGAHFAVSCLFSGRGRGSCSPERCSFSSYRITKCSLETAEEGEIKFVLGYLSIMSEVTLREADMFAAALFTGGRNVVCGVAGPALPEDDQGLRDRIESALRRGDSQTLVEFFGHNIYSLRHLFKDEQRKILQSIISGDVEQISGALRLILRDYTSMLSFLAELSMPAPDSFRKVAEVVLNGDLLDALNSPSPDLGSILRRVNDAEKWGISLDMETLRHGARKKLEEIIDRLSLRPDDRDTFAELQSFLSFLQQKAWDVDLWGAQNRFAKLLNRGRSVFGDAEELVAPVGGLLKIRVSEDRSAFSAL
ncbi:MAG: DUF3536 domain-containing protein, partial [Synergistaceae bacterium]|nr:DUF3536 domain-containing protein [Synergistaceae bacterium]